MSLAMYAAPFESENKKSNNKTLKNNISNHNTTQKSSKGKVSLLLQEIHNKDDDEENQNTLADFNPIPKPESIGVNRTISSENEEKDRSFEIIQETEDEEININENVPSQYAKQYYQQYVPFNNNTNIPENNDSKLLNKINYMIQLLEDQKDQKTNHVTEEIILYSFLGVFTIFVVDSFARAGKYVR